MATLLEKLFGKENTSNQDLQPQYTPEQQAYLDDLENQEYMKKLINQNPAKALTLDQYKQGIMQGYNYGVPEIAQKQKDLGINIPVTGDDKYLASIGQFNQYPMIKTGITNAPREGGFFNDFSRGYNENYNQKFSFDNLAPSNKGWATRIGEGLGTVGRLIDSPFGRGLMAYGLNNALGYDNSLKEGLTGFVGRQNAQTADRLYRRQLKNDYGYTEDDLQEISGNITKDVFNNLTKSQNSAMNLALKQQTTQSMNKLRELQAEKLRIQNSVLPEMQKAKLLQEIAKAEHAEEMQLARINYYNNAVANPLGWANYGLKVEENERKNKENDAKIKALEELINGGNKPQQNVQISEGTIIKNKQGEKMIMRGGKWQKL